MRSMGKMSSLLVSHNKIQLKLLALLIESLNLPHPDCFKLTPSDGQAT